MSAHGHDEHDSHGSHDKAHDAGGHGHDDHGHAGHDDHGGHGGHDDHGHGGVGDYNTQPPGPSTLPRVPAWGLAIMAGVLALFLSKIISTSMVLAEAEGHGGHHHESHAEGTSEVHGEGAETHGSHSDKKAEH